MHMIKNRSDAGNKLAEKLTDIVKGEESIVLAIQGAQYRICMMVNPLSWLLDNHL